MQRTPLVLVFALLIGAGSQVLGKPPSKAALTDYVERIMADAYPADAPGAAVLVAMGDDILYSGARGMASLELGVPLSPQHVFRIGSVTKQFAAVALLKLIDEGKLDLDDPLSKFLPDYPNGAAITVRQLFDHTSGVKSYTGIPGMMQGPIRQDLGTAALIDSFKDHPVDFAPGEAWAYNNSGYVLLGAVIEAVSGKSWDVQLHDSVLAPAGLEQTVYDADDALIAGMVNGYTVVDARPAPAAFLSMTQPHAAGALASTLTDLHRWNRALHGGAILSSNSYTAMITPAGKAAASNYGFGIGRATLRGREQLHHGGGIPGFSSFLFYVPSEALSVAVLQNADATVNGKGNPQRLATLIGAYALGDPYPDATPIAVAAEALEAAQGVYRIDENATRVLRVVDGKLTSQRSGGQRLELIPIGTDRFAYENSLTLITLERNSDGKITGMRLFPEGEGEGQVASLSDAPLPSERPSISLSPEQLQRLVGIYQAGAMRMTITLEGSQLKTQLDGQPAFEVFAESPNRFFLTVVDATMDFAPESGQATAITLRQGPAVVEFTRAK
jgi:D-alanyl-D-alanine carboxypeptidase